MKRACLVALLGALVMSPHAQAADQLRGAMVDRATAPNMAQLAHDGVHLRNGHSLFPTFTTANASAMATSHFFGDTGDYSNTIYTGFPVPSAAGSVTPFVVRR